MSSDGNGKTRLRVGGLFGTDARQLFTVEVKSNQVVGAYNHDGSPHHFTKHENGVLHEKSDADSRLLWERVGQPLSTLTGSESLGTYSFLVRSRDALPPLEPERDDIVATIPVTEGGHVDLAVVVFERATDRRMVSELTRRFSAEAMSFLIDSRSRIAIGVRQRSKELADSD